MSATPELSIVLPFYNEADNVEPLRAELTDALEKLGRSFEIVAVDDGSTDDTFARLAAAQQADKRWTVVRFRRNFGQTAAFAAGFDHARGKVIITMDADLQNDPADIQKLLEKLDEGYDIVSGWRQNRKGGALNRRLPSFMANRLISRSTGVALHDYGCSLKAFRADVVQYIELYGELHRFIPAIASRFGARIAEVPVNDRPRMHHASKYGIGRTFKVLLDLLMVYFLLGFGSRPLHFFGGVGTAVGGTGFALGVYLSILKLGFGTAIGNRPLLLLSVLLIVVGVQFIAMGMLAEMVMRSHYESSGKKPYAVRELLRDETA